MDITIKLDDGQAAKLSAALAIDNANNGTELTPEDYLRGCVEALISSHQSAIITAAALRATATLLQAGDEAFRDAIMVALAPDDLVILTSSIS